MTIASMKPPPMRTAPALTSNANTSPVLFAALRTFVTTARAPTGQRPRVIFSHIASRLLFRCACSCVRDATVSVVRPNCSGAGFVKAPSISQILLSLSRGEFVASQRDQFYEGCYLGRKGRIGKWLSC